MSEEIQRHHDMIKMAVNRTYCIESPQEMDKHIKSKRKWVSYWYKITREKVVHFAEATGDVQWLHLDDVGFAQRLNEVSHGFGEDPFDRTIAHGFFSLSMIGGLLGKAVRMGFVKLVVNYGLDYVRFTTPVPIDSEVRVVVGIDKWEYITDTNDQTKKVGVKVWWDAIVQVKGKDKPAVVAKPILLYYFDRNYTPE